HSLERTLTSNRGHFWGARHSPYSRRIAISSLRSQAHGKSSQNLSPLHQPNILMRGEGVVLGGELNVSTEARPLGEAYQTDCNVSRPHIPPGNISPNAFLYRPAKGEWLDWR